MARCKVSYRFRPVGAAESLGWTFVVEQSLFDVPDNLLGEARREWAELQLQSNLGQHVELRDVRVLP